MRIAVLLAALLAATAARADNPFELVPPVTHAPTAKECGECHMAYQPALLPAASWKKLMATLDDHFGEDASLAPRLAADIEAYLVKGAGPGDAGKLRITEQRWWQREHRKIAQAKWTSEEVKSKSNCAACHQDAEQGIYED